MYAAAGGASLASRQARQRQRQNKKNEKQNQINKTQVAKAAAVAAAKAPTQSKQFHNLPANYHQNQTPHSHAAPVPAPAPQAAIRLSRVERNALRPPAAAERRHSTSNHLKEPTRARIRESPSILLPVQNHRQPLTPATLVQNHIPPSPSMCLHDPERRCSLVRQYEEAEKAEQEAEAHEHDHNNHVYCFEIREKGADGNPLMYTELDRAICGSLDYPFSEVFDQEFVGVM